MLAYVVLSPTITRAVASARVEEHDTRVILVNIVTQSVLPTVLLQLLLSPHFNVFTPLDEEKVIISSAKTPEIHTNIHVNIAVIAKYFNINFFIIFPPFLS